VYQLGICAISIFQSARATKKSQKKVVGKLAHKNIQNSQILHGYISPISQHFRNETLPIFQLYNLLVFLLDSFEKSIALSISLLQLKIQIF
jgi:hypothetical protein